MAEKQTVLLVDDNAVNRKILTKMLMDVYHTREAENGWQALEILRSGVKVAAVVLDLIMPVMNGYEFLRRVSADTALCNIPVIVATGDADQNSEIGVLKLGAWDFVAKPYNRDILCFRLKNVILRSQYSAYERLKYLAEYDALTDIYNKEHFFAKTRQLLDASNPEHEKFILVRMDINRFQLVNAFFGTTEGDKMIRYLGEKLRAWGENDPKCAYGRIEGDIFGICERYRGEEALQECVAKAQEGFAHYPLDFNLTLAFGVYVVEEPALPVSLLFDRAALAARQIKGSAITHCAVYCDAMRWASVWSRSRKLPTR